MSRTFAILPSIFSMILVIFFVYFIESTLDDNKSKKMKYCSGTDTQPSLANDTPMIENCQDQD